MENSKEYLEPGSERQEALDKVKKFKSNWIDLGEFLTKVANEKKYEEWGYRKFEEYCLVELKLRKSTAMKLTNAYFFLSAEEPEVIKGAPDIIPDYETVNALQKAKKSESCTPEIYEELKDFALNKGKSATALANQFKKLAFTAEQTASGELELCKTLVSRLIKKTKQINCIPETHQNNLYDFLEFLESNT